MFECFCVVAGQIGLVAKSKTGLMPSLTKHLYHRCESGAGVLLVRINLAYAGLAMLYTTVRSRGYPVGLYALTANVNATSTAEIKVKCIIPGPVTENTTVKYTKVGNEVSIYLVRNAYTLCVGAEVIYCDESIKKFLENVEEIPSDAVDATIVE